MTTTDDARLVEIEARERVATLGPWEVDPRTSTRVVAANDRGVATAGGYTTNTDDGAHHWQNDANACFIAHSREDVRYLLNRLKAAESRIRELEGEITYLVKVGRCGGGVSGTSFDADGGFSYSNECSLPIGHTGFHADLQNEHPAEWSDWRIRLERPAIGVYEVQEDGNGG